MRWYQEGGVLCKRWGSQLLHQRLASMRESTVMALTETLP